MHVRQLTSSFCLLSMPAMTRDQPNSREKMRDFTVEFFNVPNFTENSRKEFEKFTGPTAVISRCYVNAN